MLSLTYTLLYHDKKTRLSFAIIFLVMVMIPLSVSGQEECQALLFIRGLLVYGGNEQTNLPVIVRRGFTDDSLRYPHITIQFDVNERTPPRLAIRFYHCDMNWNIDDDPFFRDDFYTYSRSLFYQKAQESAKQVTWRFLNSFPSPEHPFVRFLHSGNWLFEIVDEYDHSKAYASGRFIVIDNHVALDLSVQNDYWSEFAPPANRVHRLDLRLNVPDGLIADYVTTVDFYKNRHIFDSYRVTTDRFESNTRFDGLGRSEKTFTYLNMAPGNGYRFLDLRSPTQYPTGYVALRPEGPDQSRMKYGSDQMILFGACQLSTVGAWDADYLCVRFELLLDQLQNRDVFVAGQFNQWDPQLEDKMVYDSKSKSYKLEKYLFRGFHDYQYVTGQYDHEKRFVSSANWIELENNFWETSNEYWAIVYYTDPQYGGFTQAVGFTRRYSVDVR